MSVVIAPAILQVIAVPERDLAGSLLVRRRDLAPVREHEHYHCQYIGVDFSGRTIHWLRRAGPAVVARYRLTGGERTVDEHEIVMRDGGARYVRVSY